MDCPSFLILSQRMTLMPPLLKIRMVLRTVSSPILGDHEKQGIRSIGALDLGSLVDLLMKSRSALLTSTSP
jgi:hypothetical protein